jgi:hypothetical protein
MESPFVAAPSSSANRRTQPRFVSELPDGKRCTLRLRGTARIVRLPLQGVTMESRYALLMAFVPWRAELGDLCGVQRVDDLTEDVVLAAFDRHRAALLAAQQLFPSLITSQLQYVLETDAFARRQRRHVASGGLEDFRPLSGAFDPLAAEHDANDDDDDEHDDDGFHNAVDFYSNDVWAPHHPSEFAATTSHAVDGSSDAVALSIPVPLAPPSLLDAEVAAAAAAEASRARSVAESVAAHEDADEHGDGDATDDDSNAPPPSATPTQLDDDQQCAADIHREFLLAWSAYEAECHAHRRRRQIMEPALAGEPPRPPTAPLLFVTGPAGTGKSAVVSEWRRCSNLWNRQRPSQQQGGAMLVLATTGLAAYSIRGQTIHSALGISVTNATASAARLETMRRRYGGVVAVVIDEISMAGAGLFSALERTLRELFSSRYDNRDGAPAPFSLL